MTPRLFVPRRAAAWLLLLLFAVVIGEPLRAGACPTHASLGAGAGVAPESAAHGGHASHASHASHVGAHAAADAADAAPADDGREAHQCDCLGTCCTAALVRAPRPLVLHLVEVGLVEAAAPPVRLAPVATSGDHVLPFANGPPTLA